jgi:hypothetical protein
VLLNTKKGLGALLAEYGASKLPPIAGSYKGGLVICGDASCIWADLESFGCRSDLGKGSVAKDGFDFMAVNKIGETFPGKIEHWYSNAAHLLMTWVAARRTEYSKEFEAPLHTHSSSEGAMWHWPFGSHGTSGLGAALVGIGLGYEQIVLCGIPLSDGPHNGEPYWRRTKFASSEAADKDGGPDPHWRKAMGLAFQGKVRSMSGRTKDWLGAP